MPDGVQHVGGYSTVTYPNYFQGIDLRFYGGSAGHKMSFYCHPGSDPENNLYLRFGGHDSLKVDVDGTLKIYLNSQWLRLREATVFQLDENDDVVPLNWLAQWEKINANVVSFVFDGYDPTRPLILQVGPPPLGDQGPITPGICWGTYFGGNGGDEGANLEVDGEGNMYMAGTTSSDWSSYPDLLGNYTTTPTTCAYLTKFNSAYVRQWTLFLGGGTNTVCSGLAISPTTPNDVYLGGWTSDFEFFHYENDNEIAFDDPSPSTSQRGFVAKFNADGGIIWSTPFGAAETAITGMDFDNLGRLVVCGKSESYLPPEFQAPPPSYHHEPYHGGLYDAFLAMFNTNDQLMWRTHYGGSDQDDAIDVRCTANKIVLVLQTSSDDLPLHDGGSNAHDAGYSGYLDAALVEFSLTGVLSWATYYGGSDEDWVGAGSNGYSSDNAVDINPVTGNIYVVGNTYSADLPEVHGPGWYDNTFDTGSGWIAAFSGQDRSLIWSTYYGDGYTALNVVRVTPSFPSTIYVAGSKLNESGIPIQPSIYDWYEQPAMYLDDDVEPEKDAMITAWNAGSNTLLWSTWFGGVAGNGGDRIVGLAHFGIEILICGTTSKGSDNFTFFPLTDPGDPAYFDGTYNDIQIADAFIAHICPMTSVGVETAASVLSNGISLFSLGQGLFEFAVNTEERSAYSVVDARGRLVATGWTANGPGRCRLDMSNSASGIYTVAVVGIGVLRFAVVR